MSNNIFLSFNTVVLNHKTELNDQMTKRHCDIFFNSLKLEKQTPEVLTRN